MPPDHSADWLLVAEAHVRKLGDMAAAPDAAQRVVAMLSNPEASANDVADELARDQVLSAKVLKLVNSGASALHSQIGTVSHAMVLLGFDVVRSLVLGASLFDKFNVTNKWLLEGLWNHSLGTAFLSGAIAVHMKLPNPEQYAVSGLLHDIGQVAIARGFPAEAKKIHALVAARGGLMLKAEREVLGFTHGDAGVWLMHQWGLPSTLLSPIRDHHEFDASHAHAVRTAVVHVADILSRAKGIGNAGDILLPTLNPDAWRMLGLTMGDLRKVLTLADAELALPPP